MNQPQKILCDCQATGCLRFRHLGHCFMEPGDYQDAPVSKILHVIQNARLLKVWNRGGTQYIIEGGGVRAGLVLPLAHSFIHSSAGLHTIAYQKTADLIFTPEKALCHTVSSYWEDVFICSLFIVPVLLNEVLTADRVCGLVVRVSGYRSRGPGSILGPTRFYEK
jgi:hypothetical protein